MPDVTDLPHTSLRNAPDIPPKSHAVSRPGHKSDAEVDREIAEGLALAVRRIIAQLVNEQERRHSRESRHRPGDGSESGEA